MIYALLLGIHLLICVFLVIVVLLQAGKGGGLAGAFGVAGGAAQTLFGGRGAATFLSKATTVLGISFMTTSLLLALMAGRSNEARSTLRELQEEPGMTAPPPTSVPLEIPGTEGGPAGSEGFPGLGEPAPGTQPGSAEPAPAAEPPAGSPGEGTATPQTPPPSGSSKDTGGGN